MGRVLVTETLGERGLAAMRDAGHEVDIRLGLSPDELLEAVVGAHALVIRSATKVTAAVLAAGRDLVVVGRAGVGVDNVDVDAATKRGVMVVNAPQSNITSTAEHTIALMLAMARNIPQANAALRAGTWQRARWEGIELQGKTLGILGLGNVGKLVAQRAYALGMRLIAWDRFITPERAGQLGVELLELEEVVAEADFLAVHLVKVPEYIGIIGKDLLAKAKPTLRIINTARGGLVDEDALADAVRDGRIAGAALDVFEEEPKEGGTKSSPLFELDSVIVTPHLSGSTPEAQDKAGITIAEQVILALAGEFVPFAQNVSASEASEVVRPFLPLAEQLGRIFGSLSGVLPTRLDIEYQGGLADYDTRILTLSVLKGLFAASDTSEPVSYVNAPQLAEDSGLEYRESRTATAHDYVNLITLRSDEHALAGSLTGMRGEPRIVMMDDHVVEVTPANHMLVVRNDDRSGMIGLVGMAMADGGVNIANMAVGRSPAGGTALMVLAVDQPVPADVVARLDGEPGILAVHSVTTG